MTTCTYCGSPVATTGKGRPPEYCETCRLVIRRQTKRIYARKVYKPGQTKGDTMIEPCMTFAKLYSEYLAAGRAMWRSVDDDTDEPQAAARLRRVRVAIYNHKRACPCCRHMLAASAEALKPRLVDPREFDSPPLLAMMGAA